jgi:branched-chain amino acid transport system substrate-binding protein
MFSRRQMMLGLAANLTVPLAAQGVGAETQTLKIGMTIPVTGPAAESGKYALNGAKLALETINKSGGVLGRPVELVVEDDQTTNPGVVLAFSRLAAQSDIVAFLGSIRSTQVHAMAPDILKTGKPVMFGGTDPQLTKLGNPWLFRFRPNDSYSGRVIADYGVTTLGKKKWAIVHSTDAFGTGGSKALNDALTGLGVTAVLDQGYANQSQDFTAVVLAIKQSGADVIGSYFTFENDLAIFARQLRQLGVAIPWIGSPSIVASTAIKLAGPALNGTYGVADFAEDSSPEAKRFSKAYRDTYKTQPDNFSSWTFDALNVLAAAINRASATEPEKIRQAILSTVAYRGVEGEYNFDQKGDGLHGYNIVRNENSMIVFDKHIDFKD